MPGVDEIQGEVNDLKLVLSRYPTVLLQGSNFVAKARFISVLESQYNLSPQQRQMVREGNHPDVFILSGREKPEEVREIRGLLTANPSIWQRRYLFINGAEFLHQNATQVLLKLIEEPPRYLKVVLSANHINNLPPTILSRVILFSIERPTQQELENLLREAEIEEPIWRAAVALAVPDAAPYLDVALTKEWFKSWEQARAGMEFLPDFPFNWAMKLDDVNEATRLVCWSIVVGCAAKMAHSHYWRLVGLKALEEREFVNRGRYNKISLATRLVQFYAWVKTAIRRRT